jgi:hypothetical protein
MHCERVQTFVLWRGVEDIADAGLGLVVDACGQAAPRTGGWQPQPQP